jgi:transposase
LKAAGISVVEVERPKRRHRHRKGKSDPIDAEAAARTGKRPARLSESPRAATDGWR